MPFHCIVNSKMKTKRKAMDKADYHIADSHHVVKKKNYMVMIGRLEGILKNELCTAVHTCNSSIQEVKMRGLVVLGQLGLHKRQCLNTCGNKFRGRKTVRSSMPSLSVY